MATILKMESITKSFPGVLANDHINLTVNAGEVLALLGENGAGKTTLMNILYGLYKPDAGKIFVRGEEVEISSPLKAIDLGIGMIHQHFMLIPVLTVAENIILGAEPAKGMRLDLEQAKKRIVELSEHYELQVDPDAYVWQLSVGQQQRVEILKALFREASILILDEPTAVLTPQEATELFKILRGFASENKAVVFISHKLKEVMSVSDRVTVIRQGRVVDTIPTKEADEKLLARLMVGREVLFNIEKQENVKGQDILEVSNLTVRDLRGHQAVKNVSFALAEGEVLGIAGVDGNGQAELVEAIAGLVPIESGDVYLDGEKVTGCSPFELSQKGLAHIPQDRRSQGLVGPMDIAENLILRNFYRTPFCKNGILNRKAIEDFAVEAIDFYDIRTPSWKVQVGKLSGGNQQKVVLARELTGNPKVIIAMHPTRGLDIGATEYVQQILVETRNRGAAVLLVSTELQEIMALSDRIAVMFEGRIMGILDGKKADIETIGRMMAGLEADAS